MMNREISSSQKVNKILNKNCRDVELGGVIGAEVYGKEGARVAHQIFNPQCLFPF